MAAAIAATIPRIDAQVPRAGSAPPAQWRAAGPAAPPVTPSVRALAGCYRLTARPAGAGRFARWFSALGGGTSVPLPDVVRLDTVAPGVGARAAEFRVTPDLVAHHDLAFAPGWRLIGRDSLVVNWHDGLYGTVLALRRTGAGWRGVAQYSEDVVPPPAPRADVVAARVACRA